MIAGQAVNAALCWIGQNTLFHAGLANFLGNVLFFRKRLARGFVFDEFDTEKQSEAAKFADVGMRLQRRQRGAQVLFCRAHALKKFVRFKIVQNSVPRSGRDRMSLIRKAVHECAGAVLECFDHARGNEHGAQRRVTAGDSFPHQNNVRIDAPVLHGEWFSRAAHAAHHFVGDQKNSALAADFRDPCRVTFGWHGGTQGGANNRLENKSGGFLRFVPKKMEFEIIGADEFALRKRFFEWAVEAKTRSNMPPFRDERFVRRAAYDISADGHRSTSAAMIALTAAKNAIAILLAAFNVKLEREFSCKFSYFLTSGSEINTATITEIRP